MKLIGALLLASGLFFGNTIEYDLSNDFATSEVSDQSSESVENNTTTDTNTSEEVTDVEQETLTEEEKAELLQLLEQWVNGEIELDEATIQLIKSKLAPVLEENIDKILQNYIEESEERQKVSAIIMGIFGALCSFLVMLVFTKGIKKNNTKATINNETFSKSSTIISNSIQESKKDIAKMYELIKSNEESNVKTQEMLLQMTSAFENKINAIMGVLTIVYPEDNKEAENNEQQ